MEVDVVFLQFGLNYSLMALSIFISSFMLGRKILRLAFMIVFHVLIIEILVLPTWISWGHGTSPPVLGVILFFIGLGMETYAFLETELMTNKLKFEYSVNYTGNAFIDFHFDILGFFWFNLFVKRSPEPVQKYDENQSLMDQAASYLQEDY